MNKRGLDRKWMTGINNNNNNNDTFFSLLFFFI